MVRWLTWARGYVEEVPQDEAGGQPDCLAFYMLHQPVAEDSETTKIRPVFDCLVEGRNEVSMNDCLETPSNDSTPCDPTSIQEMASSHQCQCSQGIPLS